MILADLVNWVLNHPSRAKFADWSADDFANVLLQAHCRNQLWYLTDNGKIIGILCYTIDETSKKIFIELLIGRPGSLKQFIKYLRMCFPNWQAAGYRYNKAGKYVTYNTLMTSKFTNS